MNKTIFEQIANREAPGYIIWENSDYMAFLSIQPLNQGHTLVIPKNNFGDYVFELPEDIYTGLMEASRHVSQILKSKLNCERVLVLIEGFEVPHVHVHLVPTTKGKGFTKLKVLNATPEELQLTLEKLTT